MGNKSKEEWIKIIRDLYLCPIKHAEWIRRNNVSLHSVSGWKIVLKKEGFLDDLLAPVELDLVPDSSSCAFLLEGRQDIRLVLNPIGSGLCLRSLLLKAWSCGAECQDGNLYLFADAPVNHIRIFGWKETHCMDITIEIPHSSLRWPRLVDGKVILRRNELIKLVRLILPYTMQH